MTRNFRAAEAGFTLVEALIALLIIMIGLLGVAGMQALAVRNSTQAHLRTLAGLDAHGLAAAMRANHLYWTSVSAAPSVSIVNTHGTISIKPTALDGGTNCTTQTCTVTQSAAYSVGQWADLLKQLPAGSSASITRIATTGTSASAYAIQVNWSERKLRSNAQAPVTGTSAESHSTTVVVKP